MMIEFLTANWLWIVLVLALLTMRRGAAAVAMAATATTPARITKARSAPSETITRGDGG